MPAPGCGVRLQIENLRRDVLPGVGSTDEGSNLAIGAALEALVERLAWAEVLDVELRVELGTDGDGDPIRFVGQIEDSIYRLVQEALNNVAKHAETDRTRVEVIEAGDKIRIQIEDRGKGFDPDRSSGGFGLIGMRERVLLAGGTLAVKSTAGAGTTVTARLPAGHRRDPA